MSKAILLASSIGMLMATSAFAQTEPATGDEPMPSTMEQEAPAADAPTADENMGADGMTGDVDPAVTEGDTAHSDGEAMPVEITEVSGEELMGADIRSVDGDTIATVSDVVLSGDGMVEGIVAQFGGVLGFGSNHVELSPDEVQILREEDDTIFVETSMTPEDLEGRPEYEEPNSDS
ncbi:PRC-barrel domain-containing protein [Amaricoccus macauensis]|uniref:PRC-barrel domain-containing protein n=1 Tax=Amaricoccus macauensis TaxID=57001 RepID=UPI003C7BB302